MVASDSFSDTHTCTLLAIGSVSLILPFCVQSEVWFYYLGEAIFLAITIAKNWRIYRIFNNKSLKMIVSCSPYSV